MISLQGYFDGGLFVPDTPVTIPERKRSIVTILDEDIKNSNYTKEWEKTFNLLKESMNEDLSGEPERFSVQDIL
jgi:hypothetical protein